MRTKTFGGLRIANHPPTPPSHGGREEAFFRAAPKWEVRGLGLGPKVRGLGPSPRTPRRPLGTKRTVRRPTRTGAHAGAGAARLDAHEAFTSLASHGKNRRGRLHALAATCGTRERRHTVLPSIWLPLKSRPGSPHTRCLPALAGSVPWLPTGRAVLKEPPVSRRAGYAAGCTQGFHRLAFLWEGPPGSPPRGVRKLRGFQTQQTRSPLTPRLARSAACGRSRGLSPHRLPPAGVKPVRFREKRG